MNILVFDHIAQIIFCFFVSTLYMAERFCSKTKLGEMAAFPGNSARFWGFRERYLKWKQTVRSLW